MSEHNATGELEHLEFIGDPEEGWEEVGGVVGLTLYVIVAALIKLFYHQCSGPPFPVPECVLLICTGLLVGGISLMINGAGKNVADIYFTPTIFFVIILPPIVFEAGYFMPRDPFFDNIGTILTYALVGTFFNAMAIGGSIYAVVTYGLVPGFHEDISLVHCLLFGSIVSAVDPVAVIAVFDEIHVNMTLYICVFGESLLNDGVAVVLYRVFEGFSALEAADNETGFEDRVWSTEVGRAIGKFIVVAGGGLLIGIIYGFIGALMTKYTKHAPIIEPLLVYACAYLAYLTAEWIQLSSILAVVFAGFFMRGYVEENICNDSIASLHYIMKLLSSIMDITIFVFLGISAISEFWVHWNTGFVIWTIIFITIYRVISVYSLTFILNIGRLDRISYVDQFVMAYGGLRGGIAFSLCKLMCMQLVPSIQNMLCATIIAVFFTSFVQGMTIGPIVEWLQVKKQEEVEKTVGQEMVTTMVDHMMTGVGDILGSHGRHWWMQRIARWNDKYITPILQREPDKVRNKNIIDVWTEINLSDAASMIKKQTDINHGKMNEQDAHLAMVKLLLPGNLSPEDLYEDEGDKAHINQGESQKVNEDIGMQFMLRNNLYANRTRVELSGQIKYRRVHNDAMSSFKKQQHEILVRRRMNSNAERMKETPEQREFRKTQRKTQTARKTQRKTEVQRKTEIEKKTETPSKTTPTTAARPISPLAVDSSSQKTRKTKLTFDDFETDDPPTTETMDSANDSLPWREQGIEREAQRSTHGRPKSQLLPSEK